jgi:hypothetical protein
MFVVGLVGLVGLALPLPCIRLPADFVYAHPSTLSMSALCRPAYEAQFAENLRSACRSDADGDSEEGKSILHARLFELQAELNQVGCGASLCRGE